MAVLALIFDQKVRTKGRADEEIELSTFYEEFIRCIRDVVNALRVAVGRS
jgi:hypothetical protein